MTDRVNSMENIRQGINYSNLSFLLLEFNRLILELFTPRELHGRKVYEDLRGIQLSSCEKDHLVNLANNRIDCSEEMNVSKVASRYNIPRSTFEDWKLSKEKGHVLHDSPGKPCSLDATSFMNLKQCTAREKEKDPVTDGEMYNLIKMEASNTKRRRNQPDEEISDFTVSRMIQFMNVKRVTPQILPEARKVACSDPRMSYAMWIMIKACSENLLPNGIFNWDATQISYYEPGHGKKVFVVEKPRTDPVSSGGKSPLGMVSSRISKRGCWTASYLSFQRWYGRR
jgi:hypothetical protein